MNWRISLLAIGISLLLAVPTQAAMVDLNLDNNGNVIGGGLAPEVIYNNAGTSWTVTVNEFNAGLNFEQFFGNFVGDLAAFEDTLSIDTPASGWSLVTSGGGGGTAGNFGPFSIKFNGPGPAGSPEFAFSFIAAGMFEENNDGNIFAAKISSQQGGFAGGFVSHGGISAVPLPGAVWLLLTALGGLGIFSRNRRLAATNQ